MVKWRTFKLACNHLIAQLHRTRLAMVFDWHSSLCNSWPASNNANAVWAKEAKMTGYSIKMSFDDKTATIEIRADDVLTKRILINRLRDLADQIEEESDEEAIL
jgi:hypothetical protein